jgi:hypothetical protein
MPTLEQELQQIHDANMGITITWLWDGGVDVRLLREGGMVVAEGNIDDVPVLPWLEGAIKKHFPKANYEAPRPLPASRGPATAVALWHSPQESTPAASSTRRTGRRRDRV